MRFAAFKSKGFSLLRFLNFAFAFKIFEKFRFLFVLLFFRNLSNNSKLNLKFKNLSTDVFREKPFDWNAANRINLSLKLTRFLLLNMTKNGKKYFPGAIFFWLSLLKNNCLLLDKLWWNFVRICKMEKNVALDYCNFSISCIENEILKENGN